MLDVQWSNGFYEGSYRNSVKNNFKYILYNYRKRFRRTDFSDKIFHQLLDHKELESIK